jgi:shikimate dehydrogenase
MTKRYAVLGSPISHSKSPLIHKTAFDFLGIDAGYQAIELATDLQAFMESQPQDFFGYSVTMPLKELALNFADRADSLAIATGAANTLVRTETGWDAFNTDVLGIQLATSKLKFKSVSIIGTGATARSAIVAMQELGKSVAVWGRNQAAVAQLAAEFEVNTYAQFHKACEADLVVSTLPPRALDVLATELRTTPKGYLLDVAYDPWPSEAAKLWGLEKTVSGLEMLIWQAIGQQRLFAGHDLDESLSNEKELLVAIRTELNMAK